MGLEKYSEEDCRLKVASYAKIRLSFKDSKVSAVSSDDGDEVASPLPTTQAKARRGAISAEPITEEDASTYVKKVRHTTKGPFATLPGLHCMRALKSVRQKAKVKHWNIVGAKKGLSSAFDYPRM